MTTPCQEFTQRIQAIEAAMTLRLDALDARLQAIESDLGTIMALLRGQPPIDPKLVARRLGLTPTEGRVAAALAEGKTVREIAAERERAITTVRWFVKRIKRKLDISTQGQLVRRVLMLHGVSEPEESGAE